MNGLEVFCQMSILEQALIVFSSICVTVLMTALICAPRRDCFFLRWSPVARALALLVAPTLLIVWPVVLYGWFLHSRGMDLSDDDFLDD
jgi:hypothetical protein